MTTETEALRTHQRVTSEVATRVAPGLAYLRDRIVNVAFIGSLDGRDDPWVLVDAALAGATSRIIHAAETLFGPNSAPAAHELEMPYLTGRSAYPPPDPSVGGGAMAMMSRFFPRKPIDLGNDVQTLPA